MKVHASKAQLVFTLVVTSVALVFETAILLLFLSGHISLFLALAAHFLVVALCFFFNVIKWGGRLFYLTTLFVGTLGPIGAAMVILSIALYSIYLMSSESVYALIRELMPEIEKSEADILQHRIRTGMEGGASESEVIPLKEVMLFGTKKQKLIAIENILKYYRPEFISALKLAIVDESNSVRVLAATAISSLEDRFYKRLSQCERSYNDRPGDPEAVLALANEMREYSRFDVFEAERLIEFKKSALEKYEEYLEYVPNDFAVQYKVADLLLEMGSYKEAQEKIQYLIETDQLTNREGYFKLMEIYFREKNYGKLREFAAEHFNEIMKSTEEDPSEKGQDILFSWGTPGVQENVMRS